MASSKKIGFFWGEEKITIVEFDKNTPQKTAFALLNTKANAASPFSSTLTEEIQMTAVIQKMLSDNGIKANAFFVSLPMKEIILRSFIIPSVKNEDILNAIKFEAKKYMPFDIQDLSFVYHSMPLMEGQNKRLQIIFFAARKEVLARYDRIFKQVNARVEYCEPYMVSLTKALLFKKEIKPTDHIAFLVLDRSLGRICFIDQGIPQFIREFPLAIALAADEQAQSDEELNLKIINEVGNSFDFYARQFNGERIEKVLVYALGIQADLLTAIESELKIKLINFSPSIMTGVLNPDMEQIYALGACVTPSTDALANFNLLGKKISYGGGGVADFFKVYKDIIIIFFICLISLGGAYVYFQVQLKDIQKQSQALILQEGANTNNTIESIQAEQQKNLDLLTQYKTIRTRSDVIFILLRVAAHLPKGALLSEFSVKYNQGELTTSHLTIDLRGYVVKDDLNEQAALVNQMFSDFKNDKELAKYVGNVSLASLNIENYNDRQVTGFNIRCS